ncbi:hypothetical protein [Hymenobacter rubripertinctus]|uniref:Uncharacterized protein n=1 Tax=Hymenobacter rubripertinctus TaxID=2029981 RepID=A0A418QMM5_9BACT|nr:hypothetical protein [Hymenobacter rubripertinctus]RIY06487.1 hypothetical protein D0T11_18780 [Hymenobacter rubripertinctus]
MSMTDLINLIDAPHAEPQPMPKPKDIRQVKRGTDGCFRFRLAPVVQQQLTELLEEVANQPRPAELLDLADVLDASSRGLAQALLVRRPFLLRLLNQETKFSLPPHEAYGLLAVLWCDPSINYRAGLLGLFQDLHQLLA